MSNVELRSCCEQLNLNYSVASGGFQSDIEARIRQQQKELEKRLSAREVARVMFQCGALTMTNLESVWSKKTASKMTRELLNIVLELNEEEIYNCFLTALQQTGHDDSYMSLVFPGCVHSKNRLLDFQTLYMAMLSSDCI